MIHETPESTAWLAMAPIGAKRIINGTKHRVVQTIRSTGPVDVELDNTRTFDVVVVTNKGARLFEDIVGFGATRMDMNDTDPDTRFGRLASFVCRDGSSTVEKLQNVFSFIILEREDLKPNN